MNARITLVVLNSVALESMLDRWGYSLDALIKRTIDDLIHGNDR